MVKMIVSVLAVALTAWTASAAGKSLDCEFPKATLDSIRDFFMNNTIPVVSIGKIVQELQCVSGCVVGNNRCSALAEKVSKYSVELGVAVAAGKVLGPPISLVLQNVVGLGKDDAEMLGGIAGFGIGGFAGRIGVNFLYMRCLATPLRLKRKSFSLDLTNYSG